VAAVLREHAEIVAALERHDLDMAEAYARRHLAAARQNFSALFGTESSS
jgi:DNA-binding GntR family transcriptional regulator